MKSFKRVVAALLATIMAVFTLTACGTTPSLSKTFTTGDSFFIDAIGWYSTNVTTLKINSDNTYELTYQAHIFGTTDPGNKGMRTIIYTGKCSSAPSADGWATHVDYTLEPATRIYFEQHEKGFGRSTIAGHCILDTANWTAAMTEIADPENNAMDGKEFLSEYAEKLTITVEDPSLDPEDVSLGSRIIEAPQLKLVSYAG